MMINMVSAIHVGGFGGSGGIIRFTRGALEHKVIQNQRAASGDKGLFRQWHQKFTTALAQVMEEYEEIVHKLAREIHLGKDIETSLGALGRERGATLGEASQDIWEVCFDKAEAEAYDRIACIPHGHGIKAYGAVYRWFTDVTGLGLAEQVRRPMHPKAPPVGGTCRTCGEVAG